MYIHQHSHKHPPSTPTRTHPPTHTKHTIPSVTRKPFLKFGSMPSLLSHVLISGPPPCTSTGRMPTHANSTRSLITPACDGGDDGVHGDGCAWGVGVPMIPPCTPRRYERTHTHRTHTQTHTYTTHAHPSLYYLERGVLHGCTTILDDNGLSGESLQVWEGF